MKIHTCCKDCVFSIYEGLTQKDCSLNKIEKLKNLDIQIIECYDEEKEFYVIDNYKCKFYRNNEWLNKISGDPFELIKKETQISVDILVLFNKNNSFDELKSTILSIQNSTIKPLSITIIFEKGKEKWPAENFEWIKSNAQIPYSYEYIMNDDNPINIGSRRSKLFYIVLQTGLLLESTYIEKINQKMNEEMWPILYIKSPVEYHNMFVAKLFHNFVGGFGKKTIDEKANEVKEDDTCLKNMIVSYEMI